jgi:UDP-N-acetyl-D-mannosaminuronate dehydrogenase
MKPLLKTMKDKTVCIVGLGYVGLPLAKAFSKHLRVIGFDIGKKKIEKLNKTFLEKSFTKNAEEKYEDNIEFTSDPSTIKEADFVLICVPTPVTKSKEPDLSFVKLFCFAKTFTKKCLRHFLLRKKKDFFGKAFFWKERFVIRGSAQCSESCV